MIHRICGPMMYRPLYGVTDVYVRIIEMGQGTKYEIRMGWTFPGCDWPAGYDPFSVDYRGNYIRAVAYYRLKYAWRDFRKQMRLLAEGYFV